MKRHQYTFQFVELMPKVPDEGVLYISMTYATASHMCFCGCGKKVVTPLSPTDWRLNFNGDAVSLDPSIGNWSYACRSHYILRGNRVVWAGAMTDSQIRVVRESDVRDKARYYLQRSQPEPLQASSSPEDQVKILPARIDRGSRWQRWRRILDWF